MTSTSADPQDTIVYTGGKSTFSHARKHTTVKSSISNFSSHLPSQPEPSYSEQHTPTQMAVLKTGSLKLILKHPPKVLKSCWFPFQGDRMAIDYSLFSLQT